MPDCPIYETDEEISQYELISSAVLSNHVTYGTVANRNKQVRYFINFDGKYREMTYYDWNGVLDKKIVYKIACSFRSEGIE